MEFKINNKRYVIYVPEDKKGYLYLVNKSTGKVEFGLSYSQAEALFGENLKDIDDKEIGLEKNKDALEVIRIKNDKNDKGRRAERVVAIWSNFKKRIMTPGGLTDVERKNGIQENPNAGPAMNKLYDTIVSISGNVPSITAYSKKWFGETGDKKDSDANYKLTEDILESMRLFTSFYTIGKRHNGAKDNPVKIVKSGPKYGDNTYQLKAVIEKIKTASGAKFKTGFDIRDGLQFYITDESGLRRIVYTDGGEKTIGPDSEDEGRNVEKASPQREDGTQQFPFSLATYTDVISKAPALKDKIFFVKDKGGVKRYKDGKPYTPPAAASTAAPAPTTNAKQGTTRDNPFPSLEKYGEFLASTDNTPTGWRKRANKSFFFRWKEKDNKIYKTTFDERGNEVGYAVPVQESFKEKREKLLSQAIFKKLVR